VGDSDDKRFEFPQVSVIDGEVQAEPVPQTFVAILEVMPHAIAEVLGQTNVVQLVTAV
jgi:hypothetical protein